MAPSNNEASAEADASGLPPPPVLPAGAGGITLSADQFTQLIQAVRGVSAATPTTPIALGTGGVSSYTPPTDSTRISPKTDWIYVDTKPGRVLYENAIARDSDLKALSVNVTNASAIVDRLQSLSVTHHWNSFVTDIPTDGTGNVNPTSATTPGGVAIHSFDLTDGKSLFTESNDLSLESMQAYATFYNGDLTQGLSKRTDGKFITKRLDLVDPDDNQRLAALHKYRLRVVSQVIWNSLNSNLSKASMDSLLVDKAKFMFECEETQAVHYDGFVALFLILAKVKPSAVLQVKSYRKQLESLTLRKFSFNVEALITAAQDIRQKMISEHGSTSCDDETFAGYILTALSTGNNASFNDAVAFHNQQFQMDKPGYSTSDEIIKDLSKLYTNMVHLHTWGKTSDSASAPKLVALTTKFEELSKQLEAQDKALVKLKASDVQAPGTGGQKKGAWKFKKVGETTTDPDTGKSMKWCPLHGKGCYMPADHDHAAWKEEKERKQSARREKRDRDSAPGSATKKVAFNDDKRDLPKKLRLAQKLQAALVTGAIISAPELEALQQEVESADAAEMSLKE